MHTEKIMEHHKCEGCSESGGVSEGYCVQCAAYICSECTTTHKIMKTFTEHQVLTLHDVWKDKCPEDDHKKSTSKICLVHKEPLIGYCFNCDSLICHGCSVKNHKNHRFENIEKAVPGIRKKLLEKVELSQDMAVSLSRCLGEMRSADCELEAQGTRMAEVIETSFDTLHEVLEGRKLELLKEAGRRLVEESLCSNSARVQDSERQSVNTERSVHTERQSVNTERQSVNTEAASTQGVEVKCVKTLQQLCLSNAAIIRSPVQAILTAEETVKINERHEATLTLRLANSKLPLRTFTVVAHLDTLSEQVITNCEVYQTSLGKYSIWCTPTTRGRHKLNVSVDGHPVAGSPSPVFVSIPLTKLGKTVKTLTGFSRACSLVVNSIGEVVVTDDRRNILKFDREGKRHILVESSKRQLKAAYRLAVDDENNIYCIDDSTNKLLKCDKNGGNQLLRDIPEKGLVGHVGVAVLGDRVMLLERSYGGEVKVYDRQLEYVRHIVHLNMGKPLDMSTDSHGNIYVADFDNSCIQVFSSDGVFQHSIDFNHHGDRKLSKLSRLCVFEQYVYVADAGSRTISVFTTEGTHVTSFGQFGDKAVNVPLSLTLDKDGYVYVADFKSDGIQCF